MKTPFLSLLLGAATLIHAGAYAAEEGPAYDDIVKKYDRNGDGRLDEDEKVAAKESMAMQDRQKGPAAVRERVANANPEQRAKMLENLRARIEESPGQMRRFDKNANGKLDDAEWDEARAQFEQREKAAAKDNAKAKAAAKAPPAGAKAAKGAEVRGKMLQEFDRNEDGRLDENERQQMAAANRARAEGNPRILRRFDKDRDGKLDDAEWSAARAQIGEMLEGRKQK